MMLPTPQTLLLTALALLIAAATIMLACGPVAQPAPAAGDTLAGMPQVEGGGEEPAAEPEEPTATPTVENLDETSAESEEPTNTPTTEPTDTPVPNPTFCISLAPEDQDIPELPDWAVRIDGIAYQCFVITPTPTPKYPELGELNWIAVAGEAAAAQRASQSSGASGASGTSGQDEIDIPTVYVVITMSSNTADVVAWLQSKGLPLPLDRVASDKIYIVDYAVDWEFGDDFIYARIPASLLVPLSKQTGVVRIEWGGLGPSPD